MILRQVKKPVCEPVTLADVQGQCRVADLSDESTEVERFISAARQRAETITRRALITQQWELTLNTFPISEIKLPFPPLQSVDSIKYIDVNGDEQEFVDFRVIKDEPAYVIPKFGFNWPTTLNDVATVTITFTCGYGPTAEDTATNVPESIEQWILINVANLYENRETINSGIRLTFVDLNKTIADGLIDTFRIFGW